MKSITVNLAQKNNNKEVSILCKALDTEHYLFSDIKDIDKYIQKKQCYIAIQNRQIIGTLVLDMEEQNCKIHMIISKQKGGGTALINFAIEKCKQNNIPKLWCRSLIRYKAKDFYKKMGFKEIYLLKKQFYDEDCYFFGREIRLEQKKAKKVI